MVTHTIYCFDDHELDVERFELRRHGEIVHVEPQVFDVLLHLVRHRDRVVTKNDLLDAIWGDRYVSESTLSSRINAARRAVGDDGHAQLVIKTVFGRGYQFVADIDAGIEPTASTTDGTRPVASVGEGPVPSVRFAAAPDGTRLAFATAGTGPVLVKAANWMTHLDFDRESAVWRHWIDDLGLAYTLVRYDERGCGMSDWDTDDFSFDTWVDDLALVVDEIGLDRFPLLGISQGAAVAVAFAAKYPHRVSALVLAGAYPRGRLVRANSDDERREAALDLELARVGWGRDDPTFRQVFAAQFLPDGTREQWDEFNELQRQTTSPENAVRFLETFATIDVTTVASDVVCPTLLLHSRDELRVPSANARELASLIPGARLVSLPSRNHILQADEPAWAMFLDELSRFLAEVDGATTPAGDS